MPYLSYEANDFLSDQRRALDPHITTNEGGSSSNKICSANKYVEYLAGKGHLMDTQLDKDECPGFQPRR